VQKQKVKKVNAAPRTWAATEDKKLLECFDMQAEILDPLEVPLPSFSSLFFPHLALGR
jgi:hypothetical protein